MSATTAIGASAVRPFERRLPPVVGAGMIALALAIAGGVIVASRVGGHRSFVVPSLLMAGAVVFELVAVALLVTIRPFAWERFALVLRWTLLAYIAQSAIIEWSFVKNDVPGRPLAVLTVGLVVFGTIVPVLISFTVARYQAVTD